MKLIDTLERQTSVLRARDVAILFQLTRQHIYKMAAKGTIPSFRVAGAIRFDPQELAMWLRKKVPMAQPEPSSVLRQSA